MNSDKTDLRGRKGARDAAGRPRGPDDIPDGHLRSNPESDFLTELEKVFANHTEKSGEEGGASGAEGTLGAASKKTLGAKNTHGAGTARSAEDGNLSGPRREGVSPDDKARGARSSGGRVAPDQGGLVSDTTAFDARAGAGNAELSFESDSGNRAPAGEAFSEDELEALFASEGLPEGLGLDEFYDNADGTFPSQARVAPGRAHGGEVANVQGRDNAGWASSRFAGMSGESSTRDPEGSFYEDERRGLPGIIALVIALAGAFLGGTGWWVASGLDERLDEVTKTLEVELDNARPVSSAETELASKIHSLAKQVEQLRAEVEAARQGQGAAMGFKSQATALGGQGTLLTLQGSVPLFVYPDEDGVPLMRTLPGSDVELVERDGLWWRVRLPAGVEAWVSGRYLQFEGESARAKAAVNVRVLPEVSERATPFPEALNRGEEVQVIEVKGSWAHVRLPPRFTAWMHWDEAAVGGGERVARPCRRARSGPLAAGGKLLADKKDTPSHFPAHP